MIQDISGGLKSFWYRNVAMKPSIWERQRQDTIELYLAVSDDDLLYIFRKKSRYTCHS